MRGPAYNGVVTHPDRRSPPSRAPAPRVGALLRHWRSARRLSQLELALQAETSSRHLSFVETGRAQPSREMVSRLADALDMPLRDRNALLIAAGYAPLYRQTELDDSDMSLARRAIELMLQQHEPYPAVAVDRHWNILRANNGATNLLEFLLDGPPSDTNLLRLVFRPDALRPVIANWEAVAGDMIRHAHQAAAWTPDDETLRFLLADVLSYPDVPPNWRTRELGGATTPLLTVHFRKGDCELRFFSMLTTFGTPQDITLEEMRIECSFPADEATERRCRDLATRSKK